MIFNFLTMGDKNYFHCIEHSVIQIHTLHPKSTVYVYDWGFTKKQVQSLQDKSFIKVIDWKDRVPTEKQTQMESTWKNLLIKYLFLSKFHRYSTQKRLHLLKLCEKVYCFLDHAVAVGKPFVFLDADAFPIQKLQFSTQFDIGVTVRPRYLFEQSIKLGHYPINSGVIFFLTSQEKQIAFLFEWLKEMNVSMVKNVVLAEQTSLYTLLERMTSGKLLKKPKNTITIGKHSLTIQVLEGDEYNYNKVEEGVDTNTVKVVHVKGSRHTKGTFHKLIQSIK